jgi:hypothetical protein
MHAPETPSGAGSAELVATLKGCAARAGDRLTLGEVLDTVQESSYAFVCIFLALPFLQPFSLGPLAVIGGLTFAVLGWQCLNGRHAPALPARVRDARLSPRQWQMLIATCIRLLGWCARITRMRHLTWVDGERGHRMLGAVLLAGGLLMAVPFFGLPFNNALPALAIFFVCLAHLERDGVMVLISLGWIGLTLIYFAVVLGALALVGREALDYFS